jgi:hypothetical protein
MTISTFEAQSRVEINGGTVVSQRVTDHRGTRTTFTGVGSFCFFVDVVEADGTRIGMWDGASYEDAIIEAHHLSAEFGPVHDLVVGGAV